MAKLFYLTFLLFSLTFLQVLSAAETQSANKLTIKERADRASLSIRFKNYTSQKALELPKSVEDDFKVLAKLNLDAKQDFELLQNAFKTLIVIDQTVVDNEPFDPARDMAQTLIESYQKNKSLYDSVLEKLRNDKNKENIDGLKKLWDNLNTKGNG